MPGCTRIARDIYQSALPQVGKSADEAAAKLVPLQRKSEAKKAARKTAKAAKRTKTKDQAKRKKKQGQDAQERRLSVVRALPGTARVPGTRKDLIRAQ
ncbi:hypothetical protein JCM13580A_36150 [Streptomyces drozdowiczii]